MPDDVELLRRVYALFNGRDIESVLAAMHPDVVWANGMEGGYVHGRDGVRSYWKRQWAILDPHVEPVEISPNGKGQAVVRSEEHTSELQSRENLVCRLLLEKKKITVFTSTWTPTNRKIS